ncbi:hypothetical protein SLEP1_g10809 [Rubroshorea leprosula]|uniref:Uncharacterized protein n=1 Tax=Rubroshorea leprosula TaxID=152421 RepID=A0AAV5IJ53_9ROSI|nr:hypothetical protein SLEP1_g10809 [Rubroshorea leprosula]
MHCSHRVLAYGVGADAVDDYVPSGESTVIECLKKFVRAVIEVFKDEYLRKVFKDEYLRRPTAEDVQLLLQMGEARGFPRMILIACTGNGKTVQLHGKACLFRLIMSNQQSWQKLWLLQTCRSPKFQYIVNGSQHNIGYYLRDSIHPEWAMLVNSIPMPQGPKRIVKDERGKYGGGNDDFEYDNADNGIQNPQVSRALLPAYEV